MPVDRSSNTGQIRLHFRNGAGVDIPLRLELGNFVSRTTGRILNTQPSFFKGSETAGTPFLEHGLKAGDSLVVRVQVSNLWEAGESAAELTVNGKIHKLRAVHYDVPFNVSIQVATPDKPELTFQRGQRGLLVLKNEDPMTYAVGWRLLIANEAAVLEGVATLPPKSTVPVTVEPPAAWFTRWFEGFFKDEQRGALLTLRFTPAADTDVPGLPVKTMPLALRLGYRSDTAQAGGGNLIIFAVLCLGAACSLVLSLWIPNKRLQIALARKLDDLASNTRTISSRIDSGLRVALRVERLRLSETLRSLGMVSTDAPELLKGFEKKVEILGRRIDLAKELDEATRKLQILRAQTSSAPPTLLDEAAESLDGATKLLNKTTPAEADFQQTHAAIQKAETHLGHIAQEDLEFAKRLASYIKKSLREPYDETNGEIGRRAKSKDLRLKLTDLFEIIKDPKYETEANITPGTYHWIDISVEKLFVLRHYILRFDDAATDLKRQKRISSCEEELISNLKLQNWNALERARQLRKQFEQDILANDVEEQLRSEQVSLEIDPLTVYANEPTRLWTKLRDPKLNTCAARHEFVCVWDFGERVGREAGWEITHYFRNEQEARFKVRFEKSDGTPIADGSGQPITVAKTVPVQHQRKKKFGDQAKLEVGRLTVALGIAAVGLMTGAREQLLKLDILPGLIAVFLVGFSADAVKNLFAKRTP